MNLEKNYFTIDEVSKITGIKKHTLRYWEEKLNIIKPIRLSSKHRRYTRVDVEKIEKIKKLVEEGFSFEGIKKIIKSASRYKNKIDIEKETRYKNLLILINKEIKDIIKNL